MSATDARSDAFEVGNAHVNFRVRCETLGHGDEVFLVSDEGQGPSKVCFDGVKANQLDEYLEL